MRSLETQRQAGREARTRIGRRTHAAWTVDRDRDVLPLIAESVEGRIARLLPIRWQRMAASPFGFFRGAAVVMARDLASRPHTGLIVQICGDAHVRNLGAFASPEGHLVFDINDFDETVRAPFEWDLLRFATSLVLAGREAGDPDRACSGAAREFVRSYREQVRQFSTIPFIELLRIDIRRVLSERPVYRILRQAERATPRTLAAKLTTVESGGERRFAESPPLLSRVPDGESRRVLQSLVEYEERLSADHRSAFSRYAPIEVIFKVVGTGSVGVRDYAVLFAGESPDDLLFLQVKEATPSCYAPYVPQPEPHDGRRVAEGQRLLQRATDPFLGWTSIDRRSFLVRQLGDHKGSVDPAALKGESLLEYARVAGAVFARAHARTGEAAAIASYCGRGDRLDGAVADFALAYADQTASDHARFVAAQRTTKESAPLPSSS